MYYKRKREIASVGGGIITFISLIYLIIIATSLISDVKERKESTTTREYDFKDISQFNITFRDLFSELRVQIYIM